MELVFGVVRDWCLMLLHLHSQIACILLLTMFWFKFQLLTFTSQLWCYPKSVLIARKIWEYFLVFMQIIGACLWTSISPSSCLKVDWVCVLTSFLLTKQWTGP